MTYEIELEIFGIVQDVGFRYSASQKAEELELTGWVRNAPDGSLEIVAQGRKENLESFIAWAKTGPRSARVIKIDLLWREVKKRYQNFEVR